MVSWEKHKTLTWEALRFSPALAIATTPTVSCLRSGWISSLKNLAWSPYKNLQAHQIFYRDHENISKNVHSKEKHTD